MQTKSPHALPPRVLILWTLTTWIFHAMPTYVLSGLLGLNLFQRFRGGSRGCMASGWPPAFNSQSRQCASKGVGPQGVVSKHRCCQAERTRAPPQLRSFHGSRRGREGPLARGLALLAIGEITVAAEQRLGASKEREGVCIIEHMHTSQISVGKACLGGGGVGRGCGGCAWRQ